MLYKKQLVWMSVKRIAGIMLIVLISGWTYEPTPSLKLLYYCSVFEKIQENIRNGAISPDSAARAFQENMRDLKTLLPKDSCGVIDSTHFVFPVYGYTARESIGGRGRGYKPDGFDLFDMDVRGSHPAQDIFVRDKNRDELDDRTWQPVDVLAFTSGIVLATEVNWQYDSELRGGNWIWIYDPCLEALFYYAHNSLVYAHPGQWVKAGDKIAEMGRSGFNASKPRSPTHLHLMSLKIGEDGLPEPQNTYEWLLSATVRQ